jgi:hypothetical protein
VRRRTDDKATIKAELSQSCRQFLDELALRYLPEMPSRQYKSSSHTCVEIVVRGNLVILE